MATSPTVQTALSSIATRSKRSSPNSTVAALVAQQQEGQLQMQKLIQTIEKLQQENALEVQRAAQAGGGAATQVANQVTRGLERDRAENQRATERTEDKEFAVQQQELNSKLQGDAAREAATMGAAIQASRERYINSVNTLKENRSTYGASLATYAARTEEMGRNGDFASEEGRGMLAKRMEFQKQARVFGDGMFGDKHHRAAFRLQNEQMERMLKSEDPFAVLNLQTDPLHLPMPEMKGPRDKIASLSSLSLQQQFELEMSDGYPIDGMFNGKENFDLPEGEIPNIWNPTTMIDILVDADIERSLTSQSLRQEHRTKTMRLLIENNDRITKMMDVHNSLNKAYNIKALQGTEAALEDFLSDSDPAKFNDPGRYIMRQALVHTFGGGSEGEELAQMGLEFFDGKREARSEEEFALLQAMESASFNIHSHFATAMANAADPGTGGSFATQLVEQSIEVVGKDETLRRLGVDPSSISLVDAQAVMQDIILSGRGMASRMNEGMKGASLFRQFKDKRISNLQQLDIHAYRITKEGQKRDARLGELQADLMRSPNEGGPSLGQLQKFEGDSREQDFEGTMNMVDGFIGLYGELGPDVAAQIGGFLTGHLDPITSPDMKGFKDQTAVEEQRSPYAKAASTVAKFPAERAARPAKEAFKEGGVPRVVVEQIPGLLSMGARGISSGLGVTGKGLSKMLGGQKVERAFDIGRQARSGRLPIPFPGETEQIKKLDPEEIQQIIKESNRGN